MTSPHRLALDVLPGRFALCRPAGQANLPLDVTGVIAAIAPPLAGAGVPILPIATHDTDYLFLRESDLARAIAALEGAGHEVDGKG